MSPTKKKAPAPKKATAKKPAPKAAAAKPSKPARRDKPVAKKAAAKAAPVAAPKKAAAQAPAAKAAEKKAPEKKAPSKSTDAAVTAKAAAPRPAAPPAKTAPVKTVPTKAGDAKGAVVKAEAPAKGKSAPGKKGEDEAGTTTKRAKPRKPVTPTGPRHPKLGFRWACYGCDAKFYDLGKDEPICPKCGADQRDRPADEPKQHSTDHNRPRVVRPMAQLLDDDEPVAPHVEDDLGIDDVVEAGDMFEGDGDVNPLELDAAELAEDTIEAGERDEF